MQKRVFIIHGWDGYPDEGWFPWLKKELEQKGFSVFVPAMPNPAEPKIEEWIPFLVNIVGEPDEDTYFVGHSVGCQAVLRYIKTLPENTKIAGVVLVAPWMELDKETIAEEGEGIEKIAKPWMEMPISFEKIKSLVNKFVAIFSDNDKYVPLNQKNLFEKGLDAKIIIERNRGHFSGSDGIRELPSALAAILGISK